MTSPCSEEQLQRAQRCGVQVQEIPIWCDDRQCAGLSCERQFQIERNQKHHTRGGG